MILSFKDRTTERLLNGEVPRSIDPTVAARARTRLEQIRLAASISDLRVPPSNRLEWLHGDRDGQNSIRVNQQWRICFRFVDGSAYDVEFCDYH